MPEIPPRFTGARLPGRGRGQGKAGLEPVRSLGAGVARAGGGGASRTETASLVHREFGYALTLREGQRFGKHSSSSLFPLF